jgi:hypothetical protein
MIKDHAEIERVLKEELDSIELYFNEARKKVVDALSAIGDHYDKKTANLSPDERRSADVQEFRSDSADVALDLAVALRNVEFGLGSWRDIHHKIGLPIPSYK